MTELHSALKYLGPAVWADVPQGADELDSYLADLYKNAQLVIDSVPIPAPDDAPKPAHAQPHGHARNASEVSLSLERSAVPPFGHDKFQKEWGKPMKFKVQDNRLGLSVYKMSSKDNKGAWFARRSVHEGIGFSKFKRSLQMEFEKSLAEPGPPGTGNVRGIGGEERVEQIKTNRGTVEVYRLSAQFPGPTAARDFVTMLVTSDHAMQAEHESKSQKVPRHYMIISKPCDHPSTQPRQGFVRGFYESIEFIREVPRKLKATQSSIDLSSAGHHLTSDHGRKRSATTNQLGGFVHLPDPADEEDNPVEWLMITRSDPGGGIPRFLVERGTPGSICADAVKFIDWACQNDDAEQPNKPLHPNRRGSHQSWRAKSLAGIEEQEKESFPDLEQGQHLPTLDRQQYSEQPHPDGLFNTIVGAAAAYTPQVVLDRLPAATEANGTNGTETGPALHAVSPIGIHADDRSVQSTTSFASAEEYWSSAPEDDPEEVSIDSSHSVNTMTGSKEQVHPEKELRKLDERKQALHNKFAATRSKFDQAKAKQAEADVQLNSKTAVKHERELKKHEEKYQKELAKIERKQENERKKALERTKKAADKDEKSRLTRERDEARAEARLSKKEAEHLRLLVADLQKQNTALVMKLGTAGLVAEEVSGNRSRGSSMSRSEKKEVKKQNLAVAGAAASLKSHDRKMLEKTGS